jgi:hypothetical protein
MFLKNLQKPKVSQNVTIFGATFFSKNWQGLKKVAQLPNFCPIL